MIVTVLVALLLGGFAWAIGGEPHFGKWRRGMLLLIPFYIMGVLNHLHWSYYITMLVLSPLLYQMLFYGMCTDDGISQPELWKKILGWIGLFLNGVICGFGVVAFYIFKYIAIGIAPVLNIAALVLAGLYFVLISLMSNRWHIIGPFCFKIGDVKIFCLADSWWLACFVYGILLMSLTI